MYNLEWLLESTAICTLFDRGTVKISSNKGPSHFLWSHSCTPKLASAKPLDCSIRTDGLLFDEVALQDSRTDTILFLFTVTI
jgi:hypothetical protein